MAEVLSKDSLFDPELVTDLITKVNGKSSLAILSGQKPISFNGNKEFVFTMDSEIDIVAENGKKTHGGVSVDPVIIVPIKVEYGARISDEFIYASEAEKLDILKAFNEGFAKKIARGLDLMAFHGVNPRTMQESDVIGTNAFDKKVTQKVIYTENDPEANVDAAVALVTGSDNIVNGMALSPVFSSSLAKLKVNGVKQYPEFAWGASPEAVNGLNVDVNKTVSDASSHDRAIVGDFEDSFKWGYSKEVAMEVIKYGDPDNSGKDLRGYNQVYLRAEAFLGWGILEPKAFAIIATE